MDMEPRLRKGGFEMPAKKKAEVQAEEAVKETKKTAKKPAAKKTAAAAAAKEETKTAKKTTAKKTAKKDTAKEEAPKKTVKRTAKKKAEPAPEVAKKSVQEYKDVINWKKWEAHNLDWLYIEVNAGDLLTELEAGVDNIAAAVEAVKDLMLEGDYYITEADDATLSVRYYTDNLSEFRRKYSEVNG